MLVPTYSLELDQQFVSIFAHDGDCFNDINEIRAQQIYRNLKNKRQEKKEQNSLNLNVIDEINFTNIRIPEEKRPNNLIVSVLNEEQVSSIVFMVFYFFLCSILFFYIFLFVCLVEHFSVNFFSLCLFSLTFFYCLNQFLGSEKEINFFVGLFSFLQIIIFSVFQLLGLLFFQMYYFATNTASSWAKTLVNWLKSQPLSLLFLAVSTFFFMLYSKEAVVFWARLIETHKSLMLQFFSEQTLERISQEAREAMKKGINSITEGGLPPDVTKKISQGFWEIVAVLTQEEWFRRLGFIVQEALDFVLRRLDEIAKFFLSIFNSVLKLVLVIMKGPQWLFDKLIFPVFGPIFLMFWQQVGECLTGVLTIVNVFLGALQIVFSPVVFVVNQATIFGVQCFQVFFKFPLVSIIVDHKGLLTKGLIKGILIFKISKIGYVSGPVGIAVAAFVDIVIIRSFKN